MAVLCINLERSRHRWGHAEAHLRHVLPDLPLVRTEGVDGRSLDVRDPTLPLSPLCRERLLWRSSVCHFMQMDAVGAVGCYQSHVRCWEWLIANGTAYPYALIVEDDACLSHRFAREFNDHVVPLLLQPGPDALDFCVLGYRLVRGGVTPRRTHHRGVAVFDRCCWEGGHCYAVTRRGATVLRRLAYPMQVHVDMLLGLTMELGCARGVVWPASLATQCVGWWERGIGHLDWGVGVKKFVADVTLPEAVIPVGFLLVLCVVAALRLRTRKRNDDAPGRSGPLRTDTG